MTDPRRTGGSKVTGPETIPDEPAEQKHSQKTSGTNRDFDESEQSDNQGHGHPREERGNRPKEA